MTEFDVVTVRGACKTHGSGVVVGRLEFDVRPGGMVGLTDADAAGKTTTVERVQGLRRPGGAFSVPGRGPVTGAAQLRPLIGSQLPDSALLDRLRVAGALDLFATSRARDGTRLLEQFGPGVRGRWGACSLSGLERQRPFLVLALLGRPERTS